MVLVCATETNDRDLEGVEAVESKGDGVSHRGAGNGRCTHRLATGDRDLLALHRRRVGGDGDPGHRPVLMGHAARDGAGRVLCQERCRDQHAAQQRNKN